ncbi:MAG: redoxin domain-containing protein [Gammaproteobacteria bacterium]|jgi:protein SCO1/2|nr:redoxin domain-containing protein [Gammaproteobacteria bacterium]
MNQPRPPASGRIFLVIVIALAAMATGLVVFSALFDRTQELRAAKPFPEARPMPEFELRTAAGEPLTANDLKGRWSLVFFGFTNCPDICPDTLAVLDAVKNELETMKAAAQPQVVFVSVDPGRDDARALGEYVAMFDESFIGATASPEAIGDFTRQLGVYFNLDEPDPETGFYTVDHSASIYIVDPQGRLYGRFSPPLDRQAIAADLFALAR